MHYFRHIKMITTVQYIWMIIYLAPLCHCLNDYSGNDFIIISSSQIKIHKQIEIISNRQQTVLRMEAGKRKRTIKMEGLIKTIPILSRAWSPSKAIAVHASDKVQISSLIVKKRVIKKYNIIPVQRLSTEYTIVNYLPAINCIGVLSVVAKEKSTFVRIKFRIEKKGQCSKIKNGYTANITLMALGVYTLRCGYDLTGTVISSNKAVAVIVGSECPRPHGVHITEMMMVPNNVLGFNYVLTSRKDMASLYRVVCTMRHTRIESSDGKAWTCRPKVSVEIKLTPGKPICLLAQKPVRVLGVFQPQLHPHRRRPKRIGTNVILQELPSTGQFLQKYHVYDNRMPVFSPGHARATKLFAVTLVVQKNMADLLIKDLAHNVDRKRTIEKRNIPSCEFVTLSFFMLLKRKVIESNVPFWFLMYKFGRGIDDGIFPRALLDVTNCPTEMGYIYFPADDWCIKYFDTQLTRHLSKRQCHKDEGHLIDIPNEKKNTLTATVFRKGKASSIYIAAMQFRRGNTKEWLWSNCSAVTNYKNKQHRGRCMTLYSKSMKWKQTKCKTNASSLCEVDVLHGQYKPGQTRQKRYKCRGHHNIVPFHHTPQAIDRLTGQVSSSETVTTFGPTTKEPTSEANVYSFSTKHHTSQNGSINDKYHKTDITPEIDKASTTAKPTTSTELIEYYDDYNYDDKDDSTETNDILPSRKTTKTSRTKNISSKEKSVLATSPTASSRTTKPTTATTSGRHITVREPDPKTLNMTLVLEIYKEKNPGWKKQFAVRKQLLSRAIKVKRRCHCFCRSNQLQNTSQEAIQEHKKKIQKQLGVKKSSLKKALAKRISASDRRLSAAVVGCIGFLFLLLPFALIILSDVSAFITHHRGRPERKEKPELYLNSSLNSLPKSP